MLQATRRVSIVEDEVDLAGTECEEKRSLTDQALAEYGSTVLWGSDGGGMCRGRSNWGKREESQGPAIYLFSRSEWEGVGGVVCRKVKARVEAG